MVERRRIAVVGAGVAGLTLAAALDPSAFDVTIHEAQPERVSGAALGLWASSRRALGQLGVVLPAAEADARVRLHRLDGRPIVSLRTPAIAQVQRPALMSALQEAVPPTVRRVDGAVTDPERLDADLVVGADGVRSQVRGVVWPAGAERRETPWVALRGIRPAGMARSGAAAEADCSGLAREFWGSGLLFGDAPVAGGRYWFTAHRSELGPEPLSVPDVMAEALTRFADAAEPVRETLAWAAASCAVAHAPVAGRVVGAGQVKVDPESPCIRAESEHIAMGPDGVGGVPSDGVTGVGEPPEVRPDVLATRLWTTPPLPRYRRGRYVVIGDAAHASLPNLGRGASDAILDAVSLARVLNGGGSLARWEASRLPVTQAARSVAAFGMHVATGRWWAP